jgi:hypothetical protein
MAATYEPIASVTASGAATTATFSAISGTYTDLRLVAVGSSSSASTTVRMRVNSDTGTNYSWTDLYGDGSVAASVRSSNDTSLYLASVGTGQTTNIADFMSYANTNVNKTVLVSNSRSDSVVQLFAELWGSTSAITSIEVYISSGSFTDGFTLSLYGIKAA